jgi:hypothetical protein
VVEAEQIAWLRRDDPPFGVEGVGLAARPGQPAAAPLGRTSDGDAVLLLRFAVPLPPELTVVEAYVLLDRVAGAVVSVDPVVLHALRVVEPWRAEAASWPRMPRLEEVRAGETWVGPTSSHVVRVDVRDLVRRWRSHDPRDQGIALRARKTTEAGATFWLAAASPGLEAAFSDERPISPGSGDGLGSFGQAPRLELYVRAETPR